MMIVAAVATSSLAYLGPAALRPLVPASPSVRMQVTASPPAAKRPVAGGGGYLGRGNQKRDAISRRVLLPESPAASRVGGMRRKPLKFQRVCLTAVILAVNQVMRGFAADVPITAFICTLAG